MNICDVNGQSLKAEMDTFTNLPKTLVNECISKLKEENIGYLTKQQLSRLLTNSEVSLQLQEHNEEWLNPLGQFQYYSNSPTDPQANTITTSSSDSFTNCADVPLFSNLDLYNNGYVPLNCLIAYWESLGVINTTKILSNLGISYSQSVDIRRLSYVLNEVVLQYQGNVGYPAVGAGIITLQNEVRVLIQALNSITKERDKLTADLKESKYQTDLMFNEIDEQNIIQEKKIIEEIEVNKQYWSFQLAELQKNSEKEQQFAKSEISYLERTIHENGENLKTIKSSLGQDIIVLKKENYNLKCQNKSLKVRCAGSKKLLKNMKSKFISCEKYYMSLFSTSWKENDLRKNLLELKEINKSLRDSNDELEVEINKYKGNKLKYVGTSLKHHQTALEVNKKYCFDGIPKCSLTEMDNNGKTEKYQVDKITQITDNVKSDMDECYFKYKSEKVEKLNMKILSQKESLFKENESLQSLQLTNSELKEYNQRLKQKLGEIQISNEIPDILKDNNKHVKNPPREKKMGSQDGRKTIVTQNILHEFEKSMKCDYYTELSKKNTELVQTNRHLDESLEMMHAEFESLEGYWQNKLEIERQYYEGELKSNKEEFGELALSTKEYSSYKEKPFDMSASLSVIDEQKEDEEQVNVWEEEISTLKEYIENMEDKHLNEMQNLRDVMSAISQSKNDKTQ